MKNNGKKLWIPLVLGAVLVFLLPSGCSGGDDFGGASVDLVVKNGDLIINSGSFDYRLPGVVVVDGRGGALSPEFEVSLFNEGELELLISSVSLAPGSAGDFILGSLIEEISPVDFIPYNTFTVIYDPASTTAEQSAEIVIASNDPEDPVFTFVLRGCGIWRILPESGTPSYFGRALAFSGENLLIGSNGEALLHRKEALSGLWTPVKSLTTSSPSDFGEALDVDADKAVVGDSGNNRVYTFYRDNGGTDNWGPPAVESVMGPEGFGSCLDMEGTTLIVGAPQAEVGGVYRQGSLRVFYESSQVWALDRELTASDGGIQDFFGLSCALSGTTIVVGTAGANTVYFYEKDFTGAGNWGEIRKITAGELASPNPQDFGRHVSLSGDTAVSSCWDDTTGSRYTLIFYRNEGGANNWGLKKVIETPDTYITSPLLISGDNLAVCAGGEVRIYARHEGGTDNWGLISDFFVINTEDMDGTSLLEPLGAAFAFSMESLFAGATDWSGDESSVGMGSVYIGEL